MTRQPTNCTVSIKRNGQSVSGLSTLPCLVLPETRNEIIEQYSIPAGEGYRFSFPELHSGIRSTDQIVLDANPDNVTASLRITAIFHANTPHLAHTSGYAQGNWGTA
jgi:hypothetical protein